MTARGFLSLADLPGGDLAHVLAHAAAIKANGPDPSRLAGKRIALLFF